METKKYIAYGSNMNLEQMERRCPGARVAGKGWLKDHRLFFAGRSEAAVASIEPADGHAVPVVLWEITSGDEAVEYSTTHLRQTYELKGNPPEQSMM